MDNGQNSDSSKMDSSVVVHLHEKESVRSPDDILVRRLKNRERQRRYRARKRHEADLKKASVADQSMSLHYQHMPAEFVSVPLEVEVLQNPTPTDYVTHIHCRRDWKKDARRAHTLKKQEATPTICCIPGTAAFSGSSAAFLEPVVSSHSNTSVLDNNATQRLQSNRRHWKAEARNRKSSE